MDKRYWRESIIYAALAALTGIALYLTGINGEFIVPDDYTFIKNNPNLHAPDADFIQWAFTTFDNSIWHPLTWLSYSLDYSYWGLDPRGYHLTNALLHGLNTFLVTLILMRLINISYERDSPDKNAALTTSAMVAGLGGAVFAVHPIHVESVQWISERKGLLCALFWLGTVFMYLRYAETRKLWLYGACLALFGLSLMSKPVAVTLPLVLLIIDWYPLRRADWRAAVIEKIPFLLLSLAVIVLTFIAFESAMSGITPIPFAFRFWGAVRAIGLYMAKTIAPVGLSHFYPQPFGGSTINAGHVGAVLAVAIVSLIAVGFRKKAPALLAGWLFLLITLLPTLGLVQIGFQAASDRYMYLPLLGPIGMLCYLSIKTLRYGRRFWAAAWILLVVLCAMSVMQIRVWRTSFTLWEQVRKIYPNDSQPYAGLGLASLAAGVPEQALRLMDLAVEIEIKTVTNSPRLHWLYSTRADALVSQKEYEKAVIDYSAAIRMLDSNETYHYKRGRSYEILGEWDRAISDYRRTVTLSPSHADALGALGAAYAKRGDYGRAVEALTKAITLKPGQDDLHMHRANAYVEMGQRDAALDDLRKAAKLGNAQAREILEKGNIPW